MCLCVERERDDCEGRYGLQQTGRSDTRCKGRAKIRPALNMQMRYYLADRGHFDKPRAHTLFDKAGHTHKDPY